MNHQFRWVLVCTLLLQLVVSGKILAQIKGKVTDAESGLPLAGVTVLLVNSNTSAVSAENGSYSINVPPSALTGGTLRYSYIGYASNSVKINGRSTIDMALFANKEELETVVVSGYGKVTRREEVVGSIATVSAEQLQTDRAIESFDKMLEGLAAGVQVETNTELGRSVKINIRGQNSLTNLTGTSVLSGAFASTQPLYVIDGVPITEQRPGDEPFQFGNEQYQNPLAGINPDDIESISILKDAAAAAVYGSNASNGVIIITTKKGKAGKTRFTFSVNTGISNPINRIRWLSGPEYHTLLKELYLNEGRSPVDAEALAGSAEMDTDWFGLTNRTGYFQNYDVELSGGSANSTYRIAASFLDQQSIQLGNDFKKAYFRLRLDNKLGKHTNLTVSLAPSITRMNALTVYSELTPIVPNIPAYNADSTYYTIAGVPNPLAVLNQNINYAEGGTLNGNVRLDHQLLPNLRLSGNLGTDLLINKQNLFLSSLNATGSNFGGRAQIFDRTNFSWIAFTQLNWSPKIGDDHAFDLLGGVEAQSQQTKLLRGSGSGFTYYRLNELSNASQQSASSSRQKNNAWSGYMQTAYKFKGKYFANISGRVDAASVLGTDVRSTLNAAIGVGWLVHKEAFLANSKAVDILQMRASYGTTGNSRIGSYEARGLYNIGSNGYNRQSSSDPVSLPNANLGWEKAYKTNLGFTLGLWKMVNLTFDWYNSITDDAISSIEVPYETGFTTVLANTAKMRNRGWDASLNIKLMDSKLKWSMTLNAGFNKNEVLEVKNGGERLGTSDNASALKAGASTTAIYGFRWLGVDPQTGVEIFADKDGKTIRADQPGDNPFVFANAYQIGDRLPLLQGGITQSLAYAGFTFSLLFTYNAGGEVLVNYRNEWNGNNLDNRNQSVNLLDRWQAPGDIASLPKLSRQALSGIRFVPTSSRNLYSGTYIKLNNVSLGYKLPDDWSGVIKATAVSAFINMSNIWYWYQDDAPDGRNGIRQYRFSFPEAQSITGGVKINW